MLPFAISVAHVMICFMLISSLASLDRYSYNDPPLAYSKIHTYTRSANHNYNSNSSINVILITAILKVIY